MRSYEYCPVATGRSCPQPASPQMTMRTFHIKQQQQHQHQQFNHYPARGRDVSSFLTALRHFSCGERLPVPSTQAPVSMTLRRMSRLHHPMVPRASTSMPAIEHPFMPNNLSSGWRTWGGWPPEGWSPPSKQCPPVARPYCSIGVSCQHYGAEAWWWHWQSETLLVAGRIAAP